MRRLAPILLLAVAGAACAPSMPDLEGAAATTSTPAISVAPTEPATAPPQTLAIDLVVPEELAGLELLPISIEDGDVTYVLTVAVADTQENRNRGLMSVPDLGDLDGMLFDWGGPTTSTFWMKDTLLALDIAFFSEDGTWVDNFPMQPCEADPCESYAASGQYRYAIEVPQTGFAALTPAARLVIDR